MSVTPFTREPIVPDKVTGLPENSARRLAESFNLRVIFFLLVHMPLAYAIEAAWPLATAHAALVALLGVRWAWLGRSRRVLYTMSYIAGAEVLWRMGEARVNWEFGKYALVLVAGVALLSEWRRGDARLRSVMPVLLLVAALPGIVMSVLDLGPSLAFDEISFNLSAYFALVLVGLYLWARPINRPTAARALLALMAPTVGILFLAGYSTIANFTSEFGRGSSWTRSGDFGANQVANMLSLGALCGFILLILLPRARAARLVIGLLTVAMIIQGVLTFSRGGLYSLVLAGLAFGLHLWRTPAARGRFVLLTGALTALIFAGFYPWLDTMSAGAVTERFQSTDSTGRLELVQSDWLAFQEYPILGAGVGGSMIYHEYYLGYSIGTHTEFSRLLGEHGLFGIAIMAILGWMLLRRYLGNPPGLGRAMSASMAVWALSMMFHSATRVAAIPFALALVLVAWKIEEERQPAEPQPAPLFGARPGRLR
jgi:O-antigen ligase